MKWIVSAIVLTLLSLFAPLYWLWGAESSVGNMSDYETLSTLLPEQNYSDNSEPSPQNLNEQRQPLLNPNNPWNDLRNLINEGLQGLSESNEALNQLERELETLKVETSEQRQLYEESQRLLTFLRQSLEEAQNSVDIAIDRMQDAEDYALWIDAQNELLKQQVQQFRRSALIGFTFGGVSFGIGTPLIVEGIRTDNKTMMWSGVGVVGAGALIWTLGHFIFQWW